MKYSPWRKPQAGIAYISAHTDFIEDTTGRAVQFFLMALSLSPLIRFGSSS